jgi:endonuclease/exonuclease/phosphatase family metal-dependent hydrolase
MNTQLDNYGRNAAGNGATLICEKAAEFGLPVIFAGDFQVNSNAKPYKNVVDTSFVDALAVAEKVEDKGATYHNYTETKQNLATSHVFVSRGLCAVSSYDLLTEKVDGGFVSAHWAIVTEIKY